MSSGSLPKAAGAEYLTEVLRRSGLLGHDRVREVIVDSSRETILSRIVRLRLEHGDEPEASLTLILKSGLADRNFGEWHPGRQEVAFYREVAPVISGGLLPRCFDAEWDDGTREWHLLLEDLSDSHVIPTIWPLPPTTEQCERIIDARARFHAQLWDDPRLGVSIGAWRDPQHSSKLLHDLTRQFARFADQLGDRLAPRRRELYEQFLSAAPRLLARYQTRRNVTIIHGDAHVWNCFLPRNGGGDIRLFDWDGWRINIGSSDLAYMMALHWYPDHRRRLEQRLLDRYHTTLVENGVGGYPRNALDDDYRLSVLWQIVTPVLQAEYKIPPMIWWNHFERIMLAVDDLGCRELLG